MTGLITMRELRRWLWLVPVGTVLPQNPVQLICPDCEVRVSLPEMRRHYRETGHGRRSRP